MLRMKDKVVLVTGGASGIGLSAAQLMAREGAKVVIADFNVNGAKEAAANIQAQGGEAVAVFLDAGDEFSIKEAVEFTVQQYGKLTSLFNNVGLTNLKKDLDVVNVDLDEWDRLMNVNLTRYIATQYGKHNIRCNAVAPGLILTPAAQNNMPPDVLDMFAKYNALPYHGEPDDIGYTVVFLASDESKFITGQTIQVEGGHYIANPTVPDFEQFMKLHNTTNN
ncbi:SDR family NAD(P)-dependent oxidoreductase [Paenibacillus sp. OK003]|uniref:SDR family NAD(P)-dependent oxidoreductase n=1 Tax=Paenibacillus sp. OK003 TaxID=1884380 RepID=UPI0008C24E5F|nr:SDR family oxidoreductase [Paenibacillus sp. OK003]SEK39687.1 NAD(P)-dependent dehydrogenase, short-chain alcohol dehydrogenase family [Paenibacillus sp. OK003]